MLVLTALLYTVGRSTLDGGSMMEKRVFSLRVAEDLALWVEGEAARQGVSRQDLLAHAVALYREQGAVREQIRRVQAAQRPDPKAPKPTREDFDRATKERVELFSRLRTPDSVRGIKPKNAA